MRSLLQQNASPLSSGNRHNYEKLFNAEELMEDHHFDHAAYRSAANDGLSGSSTSAEDLTVANGDNGIIDFELVDDSVMLFAAPQQRDKSCLNKSTILALIVLILSLVCVLLAILLIVCETHLQKKSEKEQPCLSSGCVNAASYVQQAMDTSANPCEDFYQFSCGGWQRAHPIPDGKSYWGVDSIVWQKNLVTMRQSLEIANNTLPINLPANMTANNEYAKEKDRAEQSAYWKARELFRVCMNDTNRKQVGATPLKEIIRQFGGFCSSVDDYSREVNASFIEKLVEAHGKYSAAALFATFVTSDDHNSTQNVIKVKQSGLSLLPVYYNNNRTSKKIYEAYKAYMVRIRVLLGETSNSSIQQMHEVLEFETQISKIFVAMVNMTTPSEAYQKMSLKRLQSIVKTVDWLRFYSTIFEGFAHVSPSTVVVMASVSYFTSLDDIIRATPQHVLHNYLIWTIIRGFVSYLTDDFIDAKKPLLLVLEGAYEETKRWKFCTSYVDSSIGLALSSMFVDRAFAGTSKSEASEMVETIRLSFAKTLSKLSWMDEETKAAALEKVKAVKQKIGYPSILLNQFTLDEKYKFVSIVLDKLLLKNGEGFFASNLRVLEFAKHTNRQKLGRPVDKTIWEMTAPQVNAYYNPNGNEIVGRMGLQLELQKRRLFPAGILQSPFFHEDFPKAMNYGGIGSVIGHELLHGFDNTGRRFDKYGNSGHPWWSNSSINSFKEKIKCYIEEYSHLIFKGKAVG